MTCLYINTALREGMIRMTDTVNVKWHDGTTREVPADAVILNELGGVLRASEVSEVAGKAVLAEADEPPIAKPEGIDPHSLKEWTLCEIKGVDGRIFYREVKEGLHRQGEGGIEWDWGSEKVAIVRTIHRPAEGMNLTYDGPDYIIDMHVEDPIFQTEGGGGGVADVVKITGALRNPEGLNYHTAYRMKEDA